MADEAALLEGVFDDDTTASAAAAGSVPLRHKIKLGKGETLGVDEGPEPVLAPSSSQNAISKPERPTQLPILLLKRARGSVYKKLTARFIRKNSRR